MEFNSGEHEYLDFGRLNQGRTYMVNGSARESTAEQRDLVHGWLKGGALRGQCGVESLWHIFRYWEEYRIQKLGCHDVAVKIVSKAILKYSS